MPVVNREKWAQFLNNHPNAHILQSELWGELKSIYGWEALYIIAGQSGAQMLFRKMPLGYKIAYVPKGPVGNFDGRLIQELYKVARSKRAIVLYIEPDMWEDDERTGMLSLEGFTPANISIQPGRTICISLEGEEAEWLSRMKQKTRYNIRLADRKAVVVDKSDNVEAFTEMMAITGSRDAFGVHAPAYYRDAYKIFSPHEKCALFLAKYEGNPLAGIMVFKQGDRAWYFYGASNNEERNRMPTYLVQWKAMQWAAAQGCKMYDLWGIPDEDEDTLERDFMNRSDGLWGVYRFKRGFGGEIRKSAGVYQRVINNPLFRMFSIILKLRKSQAI